ncbi:hypothetical protein Tco_0363320 [Tanacetum coccineum]
MEEYIRLEEEKARKHGKVFNWQTTTYGKIRVDDDFYDLRSMEAEFPAIVINDDFAPQDTLQCKSQAPEKVTVTDLFYPRGMDIGLVNVPYLLARYLRLCATGRKSGAHISSGFLFDADRLGLRLQICVQVDDTWAWVDMGPKRQPDATAGAPVVAEDALAIDEGDQAILAPI